MTDNVTTTGAIIRTDDVGGGVQIQVMKLALGTDGAEDCLLDSGQQAMANSLPVVLASDQTIRGLPSLATDCHAPADNTAAVVTYSAASGQKHYIHDIFWGYDSDLTAVGTLQVTDDSAVVFGPLPITASGPGFLHFNPPIVSSTANKAMVVTLSTGGTTVQGVLSCRHEVR
jgi:hypothetical protein